MLDKEFLDKVVKQIVSETRINNDAELLHTPFHPYPILFFEFSRSTITFSIHGKEVYGIKAVKEIKYVWAKYKEGIVSIINDKELV